MTRLHRMLIYALFSIASVGLGAFAPDPRLLNVFGLAPAVGVAIAAVVVGLWWHHNDSRTHCAFFATMAGLASIFICVVHYQHNGLTGPTGALS